MNLTERGQGRFPFPELLELLESPVYGFRPFGQIIRVEDRVADGHYTLRAELPGIDPDKDLEVTVGHGMLHIRAEKTKETTDTTEPRRTEIAYGAFSRTITLPPTAKAEDVTAVYRDGILEITVGLKEEAKTADRRILVQH
ncbi:Hsp20/alpha crystallin family protein [Microbispora sp. H11081]|uniref:Hsp20/alpha crystallin family protein n=1 Tax=Microbispora sp. H11081 TaxID=2729107 RepID=UPI0014752149|nr:Hsp20/alpha crystallin family protein [Microbispora sp. H11081]